MYNPNSGGWRENGADNFIEHFETTYYLKYNIEKALYSLSKIMESEINYSEFSNICVYYHFYIDNVLNAIGHIRRRFYNNADSERIERNRKEYNYNSTDKEGNLTLNYPIIGSNTIRNFIEHIDEKDEKLMKNKLYNGCFNVIYEGMNKEMKEELLNNEKKQNNLLNVLTKEYNILNIEKDTGDIKEYKLNLVELKRELENLKKINAKIWDFLTDSRWGR